MFYTNRTSYNKIRHVGSILLEFYMSGQYEQGKPSLISFSIGK